MSTMKFQFQPGDLSGSGKVWKTASVDDNQDRLLVVSVHTHSTVYGTLRR